MELDDAYDNSGHVPGAAEYPDRWADAAAEYRSVEATIGRAKLNQSYGSGPRQKFDLFYPSGRPEGLAVFVHGGYWRRFGREDFSHLAAGMTGAGWACAMPSYTLAPEARVSAITEEIAEAVLAASFMVAGPIALVGHSAGGHLVARMASSEGPLDPRPAERLASVLPISPVSDLRPLLQTSINADLHLDAAEAAAESPALGRLRDGVAATVWVGADELPAFIDQAHWLGEAWGCEVDVAAGRHHFDVIDDLADPGSAMVARLLRP